MIDKDKFHVFNYIKKDDYVGSMDGMRYLLRKTNEEEPRLELVLWPEPYSYGKTEEKKKQRLYFPFSEAGLSEAVDSMNEQLISQKALWDLTNSSNY